MSSPISLYLQASLLFLTTLAGGLLFLPLYRLPLKNTKLMLTFGGSYLFSTTLLHILPELFGHTPAHSSQLIGIYLLIGFYFQLFLDFLGQGICHGHAHAQQPHYRAPHLSIFLLLFPLCMHALLEGIFIATSTGNDTAHQHLTTDTLLIASIILHKIPVALSLTTALHEQKTPHYLTFISLFLFALATPIAFLITNQLQDHSPYISPYLHPLAAISTGSIIHISATILFESDIEHNLSLTKWITIVTASLLSLLTTIL